MFHYDNTKIAYSFSANGLPNSVVDLGLHTVCLFKSTFR